MTNIKLSPNFTLKEMTRSSTADRLGISNTVLVGSENYHYLATLCNSVLEPIRALLSDNYGRTVVIDTSSGFRCIQVNKSVGGVETSAHCMGRASDFSARGVSPAEVVALVRKSDIPFDKIINEFDEWVHVQVPLTGNKPRREVYKAVRVKNRVVYNKI